MESKEFYEISRILTPTYHERFSVLRDELNFETDYELMMFLIAYLDNRLMKFDYNTSDKCYRDIKNIINYIMYDPKKIDIEDQKMVKIYSYLNNTYIRVLNIITRVYVCNNIYSCEKNIKCIDNVKLKLESKLQEIAKNYDVVDLNDRIVNECIKKLIYEVKDYSFFDSFMQGNQSYYIMIDENNEILEEITKTFIELYKNNSTYEDKLYFNNILINLISSEEIGANINVLSNLLNNSKVIFNTEEEKKLYDEVLQHVYKKVKIVKELEDAKESLTKKILYTDQKRYCSDEISNEGEPFNPIYDNHVDKYVVTIDSNRTTRFEDAIGYELNADGTAIIRLYTPDVTEYMNTSKKRHDLLTSYKVNNYLFSNDFIDKNLSLKEGRISKCVCYEMSLDKEFNVTNCKIYRAAINVAKNMNYNDVDKKIRDKDARITVLYNCANNFYDRSIGVTECNDLNAGLPNVKVRSSNSNFIVSNIINAFRREVTLESSTPLIVKGKDKQKIKKFYEEVKDIGKKVKAKGQVVFKKKNDNEIASITAPLRERNSIYNQYALINTDKPQIIGILSGEINNLCNIISSVENKEELLEHEMRKLVKTKKNR